MKKSLFNKSAVAMAAGLFAACAANAFVVGPAGAPAVNTVAAATDLVINPGGLGHSLFVPYYSAQNGNRTYLTLVNTDMRNGKAVKVRFRGASNSDDVLDFTVFLSPGDAWTAVVSAASNANPARLDVVEGDTSCTAPAIPAGGQEFLTFRLHPQLTPELIASETREGYIEIFNMADIPPTAAPVANQPFFDLYRSIEHVAGTPRNCAAVRATNAAGVLAQPNSVGLAPVAAARGVQNPDIVDPGRTYAEAQAIGFEVPTSGLMASWAIANLGANRSWSGNAVAVQGVAAGGVPGYGNIVFHPQSGTAVTLAEARRRTADPLLRGGALNNNTAGAPVAFANPEPANVQVNTFLTTPIAPLAVDLPDMSTPYLNAYLATLADGNATRVQAQNLTQALATQSVSNEFLTLGSGRTDWSFTFPTRRYNVARAYATGANEGVGTTRYTDFRYDDAGVAIATGRNYFNDQNVLSETITGRRHQLCVQGISFSAGVKGGAEGLGAGSGNRVSGVTANREENFLAAVDSGIVFSPAPPTPAAPAFCGEAGVFSYNRAGTPTGVLQAGVATRNFATDNRAFGWARYSTLGLQNVAGQQSQATIATANGLGLPVVGFAFWTYETLSIALPHRNN